MQWTVERALILVTPAALAWLGWSQRWVTDDGFIYLRVVQHLLAGHGPVFNLGERVEIYAGPLWLGILAVATLVLRWIPLEWIAVGLGLFFSATGLLAAERGALHLARTEGRTGFALPLGALVVVGIPPYWDFASSGLETGLTFGWLGVSFWGLARLHAEPRGQTWLAAVIGLGPLIRPDLAIFSAGFLVVLLLLAPSARVAGYARTLVATAALPCAYQVFRMGYFAAPVPNPALAKAAFAANWTQGWRYALDFAEPYWLWVPFVPLLAWWLFSLTVFCRRRRWRPAALVAVPVVLGVFHGMYIVRVGGDFMHARLLLPSLFAILMPIAMGAGVRWWHAALPAAAVVPWMITSTLWFDVPYPGHVGPHGITDERGIYVRRTQSAHPITLADYGLDRYAFEGHGLRQLAWQRRVLLLGRGHEPLNNPADQAALGPGVVANVVVSLNGIGLRGYAAGPRVHVVDRHGLGDPLAARLWLTERGRPGHEKLLSNAWVAGRFADPTSPMPASGIPEQAVAAARAALACPPLRGLLQAVEAPLTAGRFLRNLTLAWHFHRLSIPADPVEAAAELCVPAARSGASPR